MAQKGGLDARAVSAQRWLTAYEAAAVHRKPSVGAEVRSHMSWLKKAKKK